MIITTYTCDKCGHAQTQKKQMWNIGVSLKHLDTPYKYSAGGDPLNPKALWCRDCVEGIGLLVPSLKLDAPPPKPTTLEDIVRDLLREMILEEMEP